MPLSNLNASGPQPSVRTLKVLVALLVASNLFTGLLSVYLLRNLDGRYGNLVKHSSAMMNDLQTVTADAAVAMRRTDPFFFRNVKGQELAVAVKAAKSAIDEDQLLRGSVLKREWSPRLKSQQDLLAQVGTDFTWSAEKVVALFAEGRTDDAVRLRQEELRLIFERYLAVTTAVADALLDDTKRVSQSYSDESQVSSQIMLSVASWPVLLGMALLLATFVFVVSLIILFRRRELAD